ncbi:MATE family efflux transporter [Neolewinella agarilytica]|uniref:MATE family efflux transporter n=1 Tax=Neolewinella agarilytica TaxID=478744 RepID=UPI0023529C33|nr:MATE family efflux transporter [Neolewinella agarilytica]
MNRQILRLAIPNILSNLSVPLLSSYDTILMGGLSGAHIAAVGLGSMAFNFVYWNFGFLRMSTTGITAQAFGREDVAGQLATLRRAAALAAIIAVGLLLLQYPLAELTHFLLNLREGQVGMVDQYFYIRLWAAPAALLQMVLFGWFFGRQNATFPLLLTLIINVANAALSYYLVQQLEWGIEGVAWGTVGAQYLGVLCGAGFLWRELIKTREEASDTGQTASADAPALSDFIRINRDIFIRTVCLTLSFAFFYNRANALDVGTSVVAANVILLQLVNWLSYGVDGFAFAAESLVGRYQGAGDAGALRRAIRLIFAWGMGLAGVYALVYGLGNTAILPLFAPASSAPETLAAASRFLPVIVLFCLLATPCYLLDGIFIGLTASRAMRQTMLLAFAAYLLSYYAIGQHYGNWGLWGCLTFFMVMRAGMMGFWWRWKGLS